jgi:F-type H+-transporting ATPase subunit delta
MTDVITSARPYARAAFAVASKHQLLDQWQALLASLSLCVQDVQMVQLMHHPRVAQQQLLDVCLACAPAQKDEQWPHFVELLVANKRLALVPFVAKLFDRAKVDVAGELPVVIESARPLQDAYLERLLACLQKRFGCVLRPEIRQNPQLIGGVVVRAGSRVIDASLRGRLQALRQQLIGAAIPND